MKPFLSGFLILAIAPQGVAVLQWENKLHQLLHIVGLDPILDRASKQ
jgi:hypothetical protein